MLRLGLEVPAGSHLRRFGHDMSDQLVTCNHHGHQRAARVCDHVADGVSADFLIDPSNELVGVCERCVAGVAREASFSKRATACECCLHVLRGRLQSLPFPPTEDIDELVEAVCDEMIERNRAWFSEDVPRRLPRWDFVDDKRGIVFRDERGHPGILTRVLPVGSYSYSSQSWGWSWANPAVPNHLRAPAHVTQGVGIRLGFPPMVAPQGPVSEDEAFDLALLGAWSHKAPGWFRFRQDHLQVYFAVLDIRATH
jgi:hypothetical protein